MLQLGFAQADSGQQVERVEPEVLAHLQVVGQGSSANQCCHSKDFLTLAPMGMSGSETLVGTSALIAG
ncbi:hypothetical protein D3C80_1530910 [compost metagenome]